MTDTKQVVNVDTDSLAPIPPAYRRTGRCECCTEVACACCTDAPAPVPAEPHREDGERP